MSEETRQLVTVGPEPSGFAGDPLLPNVRTRRLRMSPGGLWDGRGIVVYAPTQLLVRPDPWDLAEPDELPGP